MNKNNYKYLGIKEALDYNNKPLLAHTFINDIDFQIPEYLIIDVDIANLNQDPMKFCLSEVEYLSQEQLKINRFS